MPHPLLWTTPTVCDLTESRDTGQVSSCLYQDRALLIIRTVQDSPAHYQDSLKWTESYKVKHLILQFQNNNIRKRTTSQKTTQFWKVGSPFAPLEFEWVAWGLRSCRCRCVVSWLEREPLQSAKGQEDKKQVNTHIMNSCMYLWPTGGSNLGNLNSNTGSADPCFCPYASVLKLEVLEK